MFLLALSVAISLWWWQRPFIVEETVVGKIHERITVRRGFNLRLYHWGVKTGYFPTSKKAYEARVYGVELGSDLDPSDFRYWHPDGRQFEEREWFIYFVAEYLPLLYGKPHYREEVIWRARYEELLAEANEN
jgi:hypothetical protein